MPFRLNHFGDDEANDIPHFEEDDELGSVRDETLEEEADEELMVPADRDPMNVAPPSPASPKTRRRSAAGGKARRLPRLSRSRHRGTRGVKLRGGRPKRKTRKAKARPKKKSKARRLGKGRKRR
jgi:hypothetical protein